MMLSLIIIFFTLFFIQTVCFVACTLLQFKILDFYINSEQQARNYREWQKQVINEKRAKELLRECRNE